MSYVLGVFLLVSPLIYDGCQLISNTYNWLRAEDTGSSSNIAGLIIEKAEAQACEVVSEKEWGLKSGWAERRVESQVEREGGEEGLGGQQPVTQPPPLLTHLESSLDLATETTDTTLAQQRPHVHLSEYMMQLPQRHD